MYMMGKRLQLVFLLNLFSVALSWYSCPFNDGSLNKTIQNNITIQAECMYLTSPLEWNEFNPNTFDGLYYNSTKTISLTDLHMKRLYFSDLPPRNTSTIKHIINYWLLNGGGGSQYGMETFGVSMLKQIIQNKYHQTYPQTHPIVYLFQYRGAGTTIIQYYLSIQSINSHLQTIDGIILDGIMSIKRSDAFQNQIKSINNRFYLYLSKCQNDISCAKTFALVTGTDQDIITVTLALQMLFLTNLTNPLCTTNLGLNDWDLFALIASESIELISARPLAAILIARLYRCSIEDQRILSRALPILIALIEKSLAPSLIDPPDVYPDDGNVLSITTVWSDFVGFTLEENFKTNITFFNDFCINSAAINKYYLASTGPMPVCREIEHWKYNYTIPSVFSEILYTKNPRYWGQFQVNSQIFRSNKDGALLLNGDLDYNSPMYSAQQTQIWFQSEHIPTKLIEMKGLTHVTSVQSYTKQGGCQSTTCTDQIVVQLLYENELNLNLDTIDYTCSSKENLIGIDWLYSNPIVNQTLYTLFGNSTTNYWGTNTTVKGLTKRRKKPTVNQSEKFYAERMYLHN
ncbi:unnamed protein product [Rotaria socialis]|nr:unnamed protein product [Rotaria socialis]